jgi:quinolinate synthase
MNSAASIKALCGKNGGIVCTSSNASSALKWAFERGDQVLFLPDQHLGRNTGVKMGISLDEMKVWNPFKPLGGLASDDIHQSKIILWKGHCSVHVRFNTDQISEARRKFPDINVIVHPECTREVVQEADLSGSTEFISQTIDMAPPGSKWAVGTEISLVNRLSLANRDKLIFCLDPIVCPCSTMYRIHPAYLLWVMDELLEGKHTNQIQVDPQVSNYAGVALNRMLKEI